MFQRLFRPVLCLLVILNVTLVGGSSLFAEAVSNEAEHFVAAEAKQVNCRVFYQDHKTKELKWFNFYQGTTYTYSSPQNVEGFPKIDPEKQNLVQMGACKGTLLVGVKDNTDGEYQSGWVLVSTGVREIPHGNHSHWKYDQNPKVILRQLDKKQGNPTHIYNYQDRFYLANDKNNGYTRIDPWDSATNPSTKPTVGFHAGGGNHVTLAVVNNQVGYGTWIDDSGPNKGRVDVTKISANGTDKIAYTFNLPTGAIHGATTSNDKVFFAPADGICWVQADLKPRQGRSDVKINHIALGKNPETEKPLRTSVFTTHRDHVLFVKGNGDFAALCIANTAADSPKLTTVPLKMEPGNSPTPPAIVKTRWNQRLAFVFHNHKADVELDDYLSIFDIDPNGDMNFEDTVLLKTIKVGASAVEGHYGHNEIAFDHANRLAFWTNPGDGSINVISLRTLKFVTNFKTGGMPTRIHLAGERDVWAH